MYYWNDHKTPTSGEIGWTLSDDFTVTDLVADSTATLVTRVCPTGRPLFHRRTNLIDMSLNGTPVQSRQFYNDDLYGSYGAVDPASVLNTATVALLRGQGPHDGGAGGPVPPGLVPPLLSPSPGRTWRSPPSGHVAGDGGPAAHPRERLLRERRSPRGRHVTADPRARGPLRRAGGDRAERRIRPAVLPRQRGGHRGVRRDPGGRGACRHRDHARPEPHAAGRGTGHALRGRDARRLRVRGAGPGGLPVRALPRRGGRRALRGLRRGTDASTPTPSRRTWPTPTTAGRRRWSSSA